MVHLLFAMVDNCAELFSGVVQHATSWNSRWRKILLSDRVGNNQKRENREVGLQGNHLVHTCADCCDDGQVGDDFYLIENMVKNINDVESILTMLASEEILRKDWDNELDERWNNV